MKIRATSNASNSVPDMTVKKYCGSNPTLKYTSKKNKGRTATMQASNNRHREVRDER